MGATVSHRAGERVLEQFQLVVASHERRDGYAGGSAAVRADGRPGPDRLLAATYVDRTDLVDLDPAERQPVRRGADQDLTRLGGLLQASREVDGLTGGERRVARARHHLARLDAEAGLQLQVADRVEDCERRANGALRIVLVGLRNSERGHDRVAGEFLDGSAVALDAARNLVEEPGHAPAHDLGVAGGDQRRRVDEIDEQDRGQLPFHKP